MKKSLISLVLAFSLVLSVAVPAFAATPSDVKGTAAQTAVEELIALGVINGYSDGTFKPENDITRAELAKLIVVATGNESAANLMASVKSDFTDVKTTNWANGYINAAAAKGFIKGDGNGKFRPDDNVKFEEVVAILVRALGYQESKLTGSWPFNYLLAAQDIQPNSLYEGLDITPGINAKRGIVAQLVSNAINSNTVKYGENGLIVESNKLISKIGNTSTAVVTAPALDSNGKIELDGVRVATASNFVVTGGDVLADLLGHTVTVVKTKNGAQVLAVTDGQAAGDIVSITTGADTTTVNYSTYVKDKNGNQYQFVASNLKYFSNYSNQALGATIAGGTDVTLFLNADGKVQFITKVTYTNNKVVVSYDSKTSFRDARINYNGGAVDVNDSTIVKLNGNNAAVTDLAKNDVIRFVADNNNKAIVIEATRSTVVGKITQIKTEGVAPNETTYYTVDGTTYKYIGATALTTGTEYTFLLNKDNNIVSATTASANDTSAYAVAYEAAVTGVSVIKDGEVVPGQVKLQLFSVKANAKVTVYLAPAKVTGTVVDNSIVKLTYDANGNVTAAAVVGDAATGTPVTAVTDGSITVSGSTYYVNSNTVYVNANDRNANNFAVAAKADIAKNDGVAFVVASNGINADLVVLVTDADAVSTEATVIGTYVSKYTVTATNGTVSHFVTLNVKGASQDIAVTDISITTAANKFDLVKLSGLTGGKYGTAEKIATATTLTDVSASNSTFVANGVSYIVTPNTVVYAVDKDNNVSIDAFAALTSVDGGVLNTDYSVAVVASDVTVGGTYKEAAAVVVKKLK